ncbi:MAG: hypothetical protein ACOX4B_01615 [Bacillota bacterium]
MPSRASWTAATLTLNEDETDGRFDLTDEDVALQVALYLLDGTEPADFLKGKEAVEASYTVEATDRDWGNLHLGREPGICRWRHRAMRRYDAAKEAFLEYLEGEVEKITVAEVVH